MRARLLQFVTGTSKVEKFTAKELYAMLLTPRLAMKKIVFD